MIKTLFLVETGHGIGHLTRCLNLARFFEKKYNTTSFFLTLGGQGIEKINYEKQSLPRKLSWKIIEQKLEKIKPDILVMDILNIHKEILKNINKKKIISVVIFDFLLKKSIPSDITVNHNLNMVDYKSKFSECLLGPKYVILGDYFRNHKKTIKKEVNSLMVSMGGSDPKNYTNKLIEVLRGFDLNIDIVVALSLKNKKKIKKRTAQLNNFNLRLNLNNRKIAKLMRENDILLSTAGNTMYEAAAIGLPNIVFCNHLKHYQAATSFEKKGIVINLGIEPEFQTIRNILSQLISNFTLRKKMSLCGQKLIDGKGTEKVAEVIFKKYKIKKSL